MRCGLPDTLMLGAGCAMPVQRIRVVLPASWNGLDFEKIKTIWLRALKIWTDVVAITFDFVKSGTDIHIAPAWGRIDGPGNVLGWSELPCPWNPPLAQKYDSTERYVYEWGQSGGVSLPLLIAHEVGHALGLGHGPKGNVMAPYLDSSIVKLGSFDLSEIRSRYPKAEPQPPPEEPMGTFWTCLIKVLPVVLECLFKQQAESVAKGEPGPIEQLRKLTE